MQTIIDRFMKSINYSLLRWLVCFKQSRKITSYIWVSTNKQELDIQIKALKEAGDTKTNKEKISGAKVDSKEFNSLLSTIKAGDILIVTKPKR